MSSGPATDPLRSFLWGKRYAIRHPLALGVRVQGSQGALPAVSLDVSAGGVLLRFNVDDLVPASAPDGDLDPFVLVETHFRGSCVARFIRRRLKVHLDLVRLDYRPDEPGYLFVGFRFSRPLAEKQLRRLGLDPARCGGEAHGLPSELVELRAADDPIVGSLHLEGDAPVIEGSVLGLGKRSLCMRVEHADLADVARRLHGSGLRVDVHEGDQVGWTSRARLQTIGILDDAPGALELGLVLDDAPSRALRKRFRPPWAA